MHGFGGAAALGRIFAGFVVALWRERVKATRLVFVALVCALGASGCRKKLHRTESEVPASAPSSVFGPLRKATRVGNSVLIDQGTPSDWAADCRIHQACAPLPAVLPCNARLPILDSLSSGDEKSVGEVVGVRGQIFRSPLLTTLVACFANPGEPRLCCNERSADAVMIVGDTWVGLGGKFGLHCDGDESRVCCNAPVLGGDLVAWGVLENSADPPGHAWGLKDAQLCAESP